MADEQRQDQPSQPPLFEVPTGGEYEADIAGIGALRPESSLPVAAYWYRRHLEQDRHPRNTVASYMYDLALFQKLIGPKPISEVTRRDVARFLGDARTRSTRKRRLTSISGFFKWLVNQAKMLDRDPTESFYPDHIPLKTPRPLYPEQQDALLDAAVKDSSRSALLCWIMLRLGLTRGEALALRRSDIDLDDDGSADIYVFYDDPRHRGRERKLRAGPQFGDLYRPFQRDYQPKDQLFEMLPQSVNKMTERVAKAAGIQRKVTPQTLRDTFAVEAARDGADEKQLLALLGLADEARNRASVQRYIRLASPAVNEGLVPGERESE